MNLFVGQFEEPIEKLFDLSGQKVIQQLYLDTTHDDESNLVVRVNVPINLSEDLNLILQQDGSSTTNLSLKYTIHEGITVSGIVDSKKGDEDETSTDTGIDIKFRFTFP